MSSEVCTVELLNPVLHLTAVEGGSFHVRAAVVDALLQVPPTAPLHEQGARTLVRAAGESIFVQESHTEVCRLLGWTDA